MDNWIPVTSGYPLSNTDSRVSSDVIATDGKDVYTASFVWNIDGTPKGWAKDDWVLGNEKITHWQPFPALPSDPSPKSSLEEQLSAAVAREAKLREALEDTVKWIHSQVKGDAYSDCLSWENAKDRADNEPIVKQTLTTLSDTTPSVVPDSVVVPVEELEKMYALLNQNENKRDSIFKNLVGEVSDMLQSYIPNNQQ